MLPYVFKDIFEYFGELVSGVTIFVLLILSTDDIIGISFVKHGLLVLLLLMVLVKAISEIC